MGANVEHFESAFASALQTGNQGQQPDHG